jgi:hypothetical protein
MINSSCTWLLTAILLSLLYLSRSSHGNLYVAGESISGHAREKTESGNEGMSWTKMIN